MDPKDTSAGGLSNPSNPQGSPTSTAPKIKNTPPPPPPWKFTPGSDQVGGSVSMNKADPPPNPNPPQQSTQPTSQMLNTVASSKAGTKQVQQQEKIQKKQAEETKHKEELKKSGEFVSLAKGSYTYAGFWKRWAAISIDGVILAATNITLSVMFTNVGTIVLGFHGNDPTMFSTIYTFITDAVVALTSVIYAVYFIGAKGKTPGKMAMKIKVLKEDINDVPGYMSAFLREVVGKFISAIIFFLGYLWMLKDPKKQTLHDKIAGTIVINEESLVDSA
jgi:uncharacterized RDD family membrane protein YckC